MKCDWATVQGWFAVADFKKRSKKVSLCNIVFPCLSFVMIKFVALRVIINDLLAKDILGKMLGPRRARITSCHVVEQCRLPGGMHEEVREWEVWDEAPQGEFSWWLALPHGCSPYGAGAWSFRGCGVCDVRPTYRRTKSPIRE